MDGKKTLLAGDVKNITLTDKNTRSGWTKTYGFECDIGDRHIFLEYTVEKHDDGDYFAIYGEYIQEHMSQSELEKLADMLEREILFTRLRDRILDAKDVDGLDSARWNIMEEQSPYFPAVAGRVWNEYKKREDELGIWPDGFGDEDAMLDYLKHGLDLYCPDTGEYVFLYNDSNAICRYTGITKERAEELEKLTDEAGECCWSAVLGPGGEIYDDPMDYLRDNWDKNWRGCASFRERGDEEAERW